MKIWEPHLANAVPSPGGDGCRSGGAGGEGSADLFGVWWRAPDPAGARVRPAAVALQGLRAAVHAHGGTRQAAGGEGRGGLALLHGPVLERGRQAAGRVGAGRDALGARACAHALFQAAAERRHGGGRDRRGAAPRSGKARKLWVWKAFERGGGRLIDRGCGGRDADTLARLLDRLEPWRARLFRTDDWAPRDAALLAGRHCIGKDQAHLSESCRARLRHWFARFRHRTCVVSKSVGMAEATLALFAFCHCNGGQIAPALVKRSSRLQIAVIC